MHLKKIGDNSSSSLHALFPIQRLYTFQVYILNIEVFREQRGPAVLQICNDQWCILCRIFGKLKCTQGPEGLFEIQLLLRFGSVLR